MTEVGTLTKNLNLILRLRVRSAEFKILAKCQKYDLKITDSIIIHRLGTTLNSHDASLPLHILR